MEVRPAGESDLASLMRLRSTWRGAELTPDFAESFTSWFGREGSNRWWWLALDGSAAVGMVNLKLYERMPSPAAPASRWGYLGNLFVLPTHRDRCVGGQLVEALLERAREEGLVRVVLSPSDSSVPLYQRHGFRADHGLLVCPLSERP